MTIQIPEACTTEQHFEAIADGLSEKGYAIIDDFFSREEITIFSNRINNLDDAGGLRPAGIGAQENFQTKKAIRGDEIKWIEPGQSIAGDLLLNRMHELTVYLNRTCFLGIQDAEFHFAKYPIGAFYKRHTDNFHKSSNRKISIVSYLNQDWNDDDGGELRIYFPMENNSEKIVDVLPIGGRVACFLSHIEHEVLPAKKERMSATGWLLQDKKIF